MKSEPEALVKQAPKETIHYIDYRVEGTRFLDGPTIVGWRITTTDQTSQHEHEYWVQGAEIFLADFRARKPWNHATPFIVGKRATRISSAEKQAITRAILHWNPAVAKDANTSGRKIKVIKEGPYVGVGVRRFGR